MVKNVILNQKVALVTLCTWYSLELFSPGAYHKISFNKPPGWLGWLAAFPLVGNLGWSLRGFSVRRLLCGLSVH